MPRYRQPGQRLSLTQAAGIALVAGGLMLGGCERQAPEIQGAAEQPNASLNSPQANAITRQLWQNQIAAFSNLLQQTTTLQQAIDKLIMQPDSEHLQQARQQWHTAHNALLYQTPLFALGSINPGLFQQINQSYVLVDAQPIQPGYLDYFEVYQHSGIVNDIAAPLTAEDVRQQHRFSDDSDISLGFHAIAYLLWGEDQARGIEDFVVPPEPTPAQLKNGLKLVDLPNHRRGTLLQLQATLLLDDLTALHYKLSHQASALNGAYQALSAGSRMQLWLQACRFALEKLQRQVLQQPEPGHDEYSDHNRFSGNHHLAMKTVVTGVQQLLYSSTEPQQHLALLRLGSSNSKALRQTLQQLQQALQPNQSVAPDEHTNIDELLQQALTLLADRGTAAP